MAKAISVPSIKFSIGAIIINTCSFDETVNFLVYNLGFLVSGGYTGMDEKKIYLHSGSSMEMDTFTLCITNNEIAATETPIQFLLTTEVKSIGEARQVVSQLGLVEVETECHEGKIVAQNERLPNELRNFISGYHIFYPEFEYPDYFYTTAIDNVDLDWLFVLGIENRGKNIPQIISILDGLFVLVNNIQEYIDFFLAHGFDIVENKNKLAAFRSATVFLSEKVTIEIWQYSSENGEKHSDDSVNFEVSMQHATIQEFYKNLNTIDVCSLEDYTMLYSQRLTSNTNCDWFLTERFFRL